MAAWFSSMIAISILQIESCDENQVTLPDKAATNIARSILGFHKVPRDLRFERIPARWWRGCAGERTKTNRNPGDSSDFRALSRRGRLAKVSRRSKPGRVKCWEDGSGSGRRWPARRAPGACPWRASAGPQGGWSSGVSGGCGRWQFFFEAGLVTFGRLFSRADQRKNDTTNII